MKRTWAIGALTTLAWVASPRAAHAWGDAGHQAVAEIAERRLDANGKALVHSILGADPLAYAAIFPDVVRSDARYSPYVKGFPDYHFFEIPPGKTPEQETPALRKPKDGLVILEQAPGILLEKPDLPAGTDDAERASRILESHDRKVIMLRYLVHVVGDLHQPLHVGNGVDTGANACVVLWVDPNPVPDPGDPKHEKMLQDPKTKKDLHPIRYENLHTVWDERLIDYVRLDFAAGDKGGPQGKRYFTYANLANIVLADYGGAAADELERQSHAKPLEWLAEAQALHARIYPDEHAVADPRARTYCQACGRTGIPTIDEAYARRVLPILKAQIAKGGARLAAILNDLGARAVEAGLDTDLATADGPLLDSVKVENDAGTWPPPNPKPKDCPVLARYAEDTPDTDAVLPDAGPRPQKRRAHNSAGTTPDAGHGDASTAAAAPEGGGTHGCSCTMPGASSASTGSAGLVALLAAGVVAARRRRSP